MKLFFYHYIVVVRNQPGSVTILNPSAAFDVDTDQLTLCIYAIGSGFMRVRKSCEESLLRSKVYYHYRSSVVVQNSKKLVVFRHDLFTMHILQSSAKLQKTTSLTRFAEL